MEFDQSCEEDKYIHKSKKISASEYITNYRQVLMTIERLEVSKIVELIMLNLKCMLKSDYIFAGGVRTSAIESIQYFMIFKKNLKLNADISYEIIVHEGQLSKTKIEKIIQENGAKLLISVITVAEEGRIKKSYYFIFMIGSTKERREYDNIVVEMKRQSMLEEVFYSDLVMKLEQLNNSIFGYKLVCLINDQNSIYFVLNEQEVFDEVNTEENKEV